MDRQPVQVLHQSLENNEHWERACEAEALEPEMSTNTNSQRILHMMPV